MRITVQRGGTLPPPQGNGRACGQRGRASNLGHSICIHSRPSQGSLCSLTMYLCNYAADMKAHFKFTRKKDQLKIPLKKLKFPRPTKTQLNLEWVAGLIAGKDSTSTVRTPTSFPVGPAGSSVLAQTAPRAGRCPDCNAPGCREIGTFQRCCLESKVFRLRGNQGHLYIPKQVLEKLATKKCQPL